MKRHDDIVGEVITALRRVIRAEDLHSRTLVGNHGVTGPQALILQLLRAGALQRLHPGIRHCRRGNAEP